MKGQLISKKRILIIEGSQNPPTFIINLITGLLETGCQVGLLGNESNRNLPIINSGKFSQIITRYLKLNVVRIVIDFLVIILVNPRILLRCFRLIPKSQNSKVGILRLIQIAKVLNFRPDIIHIQWASHLNEYTELLKDSSFKIIVSLRGRQINVTPAIDKGVAAFYQTWFPHVTAFHAVSNAIAQEAWKYGALRQNTKVIYSPLPEIFLRSFQKSERSNRSPLRILSIGRFHWKKGYGYALDAMKILIKRNISFEYTIIAQGEIPNEIIHQLYTDRLNDCVRIVKGIPYGEIVNEMKQYSVFLLPSVEEGIANVVLEAMAVGLPVISTDCGGMSEIVIHNVTGLLIARRDPESMANGISAFQKMDDRQINNLRLNAWRKVKDDFNQSGQIQKFIQLYDSIT